MKRQATNGGRKNRSKPGNLREQIDPLMCQAYKDAQAEANWATITANTPDMESNGPNGHSGTYLAGAVKAEEKKSWPTPTALNRVRDEETMEKCLKFRQGNGQTSVPLYLEEKVNLEAKKSWATPQQRDFKDAEPLSKWTERAEEQKAKGVNLHLPLPSQVMHTEEKSWGTPTARDHKSGRGNEERDYKELTPMVERTQTGKLNPRWVETLMGLPIGWTMPSCASPVTIVPTNSDCLETESSQPPQNEHLELF
jgi:hypothetical protein